MPRQASSSLLAISQRHRVNQARPMRLYSYVIRYDFGFAPNPFHGFCTLATCKPQIRKTASVGDWVVGTGSADYDLIGKIVYAMKVSEVIGFDEYWNDSKFAKKKPLLRGSLAQAFGDNIYHRNKNGKWSQEVSRHRESKGGINQGHMTTDLGGRNVLVSDDFYYWGRSTKKIPKRFRDWNGHDMCQKRNIKYKFPDDMVAAFVKWIRSSKTNGYIGEPPEFTVLLSSTGG